jgi:ribosomal protein L32E
MPRQTANPKRRKPTFARRASKLVRRVRKGWRRISFHAGQLHDFVSGP